jgi:hypothetical protein
MDVFIGWSGAASLVMAKGLRQWLPRVIHASRPFLSSAGGGTQNSQAVWQKPISRFYA